MIRVKPKIPKTLAARIRGAQSKLEACIQTHIWAEKDIPEIQAKLVAFDADPEGWAEKHYPRCGGASSYPVQTHISRSRASLERKLTRRPRELQELEDARENLRKVEEEVLAKVQSMRPTSGRVPWPKPIKDIDSQAAELRAELERFRLQAEKEEQRRREQYAREDAREQEKRRCEEIHAIRAQVAKGPEHVIRKAMSSCAIKAALENFKQSEKYDQAQQGGWGGGLIAFVQGPEATQAVREGLLEAERIIRDAKARGEDLWSVCRRYGFYTPDALPEL